MKQVKVTKTEPYKDSQTETIVCRGKLITPMRDNNEDYKGWLKPIIISEAEFVLKGDWFYDWKSKKIEQANDTISTDTFWKILVLPENFSPKHLQAIVDSKLKDGDEVFVECRVNAFDAGRKTLPKTDGWKIKLDLDDHITLFPIKKETNKMIDKLDIYSGDLNTERIKTYRKLAEQYSIQPGTVRDIFCKGAEWAIDVSERK